MKFTIELGAFIRSDVISALKNYVFKNGLSINIDEDRGWLSSTYRITINGPDNKIVIAKRDITKWLQDNEVETD